MRHIPRAYVPTSGVVVAPPPLAAREMFALIFVDLGTARASRSRHPSAAARLVATSATSATFARAPVAER